MERKAALITGASGGIGSAIARAMAQAGYDIGIHYRSSREEAEALAREAEALGVRAALFQGDAADVGRMRALTREFGGNVRPHRRAGKQRGDYRAASLLGGG